jgi:hypothetical protein
MKDHEARGADVDYSRDHFSGFPVVSGKLLTEMLAHAAGECLVAEDAAGCRVRLQGQAPIR